MKRKWMLLLTVLVVLMAGCDGFVPERVVSGSGKTESRDFDISGFSAIQAATGFVIQVNRADSYKVQITADDNLWQDLDISRSGGTLHLQSKRGVNIRNATLKAAITLPDLKNLDCSGAASADLKGFNTGGQFAAILSGASRLVLDSAKFSSTKFDVSGAGSLSGTAATADIKFTVSGGGRVNLVGSGTDASIDASGGSSLVLSQFNTQKVSVTLSGASEARINTQSITSADLSGASYLYYVGSPSLGNIKTSGAAALRKE